MQVKTVVNIQHFFPVDKSRFCIAPEVTRKPSYDMMFGKSQRKEKAVMALDGIVIANLVRELKDAVEGGHIFDYIVIDVQEVVREQIPQFKPFDIVLGYLRLERAAAEFVDPEPARQHHRVFAEVDRNLPLEIEIIYLFEAAGG